MTEHQEVAKPKILIVEDEAIIALDLKSKLEQMGYTVLAHVNSAEKALELIEQDSPDLVLLDIILKGKIDGIEVANVIRSRWGIPVVFVTAYADQKRLKRAKLVYPFGYILKPFQDNDLRVTVEMALYISRVDRERRKAEETMQEKTLLNQILLDAFPCVALLLRPQTREIVASNAAAVRVGAVPGAHCFGTWGQREDPCPWCLAPTMWATSEAQHLEVEALGITWDAYWIPITEDLYMHFAFDITERKGMEEKIRQSEERYRTVIEEIDEGYYEVDLAGNFTFVNDSMIRQLQYSREELIGMNFRTYIPKEEVEGVYKVFNKVYRTGETIKWFPVSNIQKDGTRIFLEDSVSCRRDREGRIVGFRGISLNVTERKRIEEDLKKSEERYRSLVETQADLVSRFTPDGTFVFVNAAFCHFFKKTHKELEGKKWYPLPVDEDITPIEEKLQTLSPSNPSVLVENRIVSGKGNVHWIQFINSGFFDPQGNLIEIQSVGRDITERKQTEEEIQNLARFPSENPNPVLRITQDGTLLYINPAGLNLLPEWHLQVGQIVPSMLKDVVSEVMNSGLTLSIDLEHGKRIYSFAVTPIAYAGYINLYGRDITERRRAEEERDNLQGQLLQAQKMESVGRLAGGVAHDFNNLLTAIIGNAEMALWDEDKEGAKAELLGEIIMAGEKASGLTRQLLAFSRKQVLQPEVVNLNEIVSETGKILRRLIGEDIELTTILAPNLSRVEVDVGQIEQVIMNLAVNARDSMPGGGKLIIETANVTLDEEYAASHVAVTPGPYVLLSVSDNGIGMIPEVQERIFEPFFTTKEKGRGTGLGLATVYGIVKQSRGNIWVYSEQGQGTTFKIYLPLVDKPADREKVKGLKIEAPGGSETVLLVEDEESVRNLALKMLKRFGYQVLTAKDGQEATKIFERHGRPIDLLLTDVVMPRMGGRELAERLEGLQPGIKVLFMSGYTDNAIVHQGILDKELAFIQNPFTPEDLVRKVREVLDS